ncbi:voltage-dependent anion channel-domain-containing protein [Daldinia vernicosa]|uniref:voltage-dependent anion channel-domain-containing protein n=1 Tax=Daldinia vernicosa TaxID=114800 RepID=UPI002007ABB1|nr:voltage-dependent anion channel-domain-containing protein [Daldinia vernicosa]KAI0853822.1 voltage-dependent anion channel-domain-containing protein [Daldinia vernicosa]
MSRVLSTRGDPEVAINGYVTPREDYFDRGASSPVLSLSNRDRDRDRREKRPPPVPLHAPPNADSLARMISNARKSRNGKKIGIRDRICCHQWTWFTMTMATGGVANVLYSVWTPYRTDWLWYIGLVFFLFNICLFVMNCVLITMRFIMVPRSFLRSFLDQVESLFIPSVVVSTATILINTCQYGIPMTGPWLQRVMEWLFWIYIVVSVVASAGMYLILWSTQIFPIHTMTPVWVFPGYPLLLTAPFASTLIAANTAASDNPPADGLAIAMCAISVQGTGFLISFMICAAFIYRLMTQKLPRDMQRPGVFISIGPSGFTVAGLVSLGQQSHIVIPDTFQGSTHSIVILRLLSTIVGLWLWGLSVWFFLVSVGSLLKYVRPKRKMPFQMTWWSFVFPNTALVNATLALATALGSTGLRITGCAMAAVLIVVWALVFISMLRCLWNRELLWPKELESE